MVRSLFPKLFACLLLFFPCTFAFSTEENFLLINGVTDEVVLELGPSIQKRVTPCSTFKIALSLMGFDAGILKDENHPVWNFQEGYDEYLDSWDAPQTPQTWIKVSCLWYSKLIALELGMEKMQHYLALLKYGNQEMSGGLTTAWVNSSIQISPKEQVAFIQKIVQEKLPVSIHAIQMTKRLLLLDELSERWKLYGKTGWSGHVGNDQEVAWFVGWIEKENAFFPFAYNTRGTSVDRLQRIERVKQLISSVQLD